MSIIYCEIHSRPWDSDVADECPSCEREFYGEDEESTQAPEQTAQSETPRTDSIVVRATTELAISLCRQLERELQACKAERDGLEQDAKRYQAVRRAICGFNRLLSDNFENRPAPFEKEYNALDTDSEDDFDKAADAMKDSHE